MSLKTNGSSKSTSSQTGMHLNEFCHNEIFDVLGNKRRRYILCYLLNENSPTECSELAEQIAAWESGIERDQVPTSQYQSAYNSLYQTHLPELESAGLVRYDRSENLVYHTSKMKEVDRLIDPATSGVRDRTTPYLRIAKGGLLLTSVIAVTFLASLASETYLFLVEVVLFCAIAILILGGLR